jgi:hypothetical protein
MPRRSHNRRLAGTGSAIHKRDQLALFKPEVRASREGRFGGSDNYGLNYAGLTALISIADILKNLCQVAEERNQGQM